MSENKFNASNPSSKAAVSPATVKNTKQEQMIIPQASLLRSSALRDMSSSSGAPVALEQIRKQDAETQIAMLRDIVETKLRVELKQAVEAAETVSRDIDAYRDLLTNLDIISATNQTSIKTKVDLGSGFFAQAKVPDASKVFVEVGIGFFAEFTLDEAQDFIPKKIAHLEAKKRQLDGAAAGLSARIKVIYQGIGELMNFGAPMEKNVRRQF